MKVIEIYLKAIQTEGVFKDLNCKRLRNIVKKLTVEIEQGKKELAQLKKKKANPQWIKDTAGVIKGYEWNKQRAKLKIKANNC